MKTPRLNASHPNHVLCIVTDAHNCHAMTEELLDTWWNSLAPEAKAEIYEDVLYAEPGPSMTVCNVSGGQKDILLRALLSVGEAAMREMSQIAGNETAHA